jgi:ubiquinone/menaquinone biosynthesis C-methylase UbiE
LTKQGVILKSNSDDYYDAIARSYKELHGNEQREKVKMIQNFLINDTELKSKSDLFLLDVGCGSGISTSVLITNRAGLDPSNELLTIAQKDRMYLNSDNDQTPKNNKSKNKISQARHWGYVLGKAESLPIKTKSCDITVSVTTVHNFEDLDQALKEIQRITLNRAVITVLKRAKNFKIIVERIKKYFFIIDSKDSEFDNIFYLKPI